MAGLCTHLRQPPSVVWSESLADLCQYLDSLGEEPKESSADDIRDFVQAANGR